MEYELYGGDVRLVYEQRGRQKGYWLGDSKVFRVTQIEPPIPFSVPAYYGSKLASQVFQDVAVDFCEEFMEYPGPDGQKVIDSYAEQIRKAPSDTTARDQGTEFHALAESVFKDQVPIVPEYLGEQWDQFCYWLDEQNYKAWHVEQKVYSRLYEYAGTCDWIGEFGGWPTIIDWKCVGENHRERPGFRLQLAAYAQAFAEEHGSDPAHTFQRMTVCVSPSGVKVYDYQDFEHDFAAFKHLLNYFRNEKGLPAK